jgi:hypothetical protein
VIAIETAQLHSEPGFNAANGLFSPLHSFGRQEGHGERRWPDYQHYLAAAPTAKEGEGPGRSMADFFWCRKAVQRGWSIQETANKLLEVSGKARERSLLGDKGYALITAQNAAAAAERGRKRGRA